MEVLKPPSRSLSNDKLWNEDTIYETYRRTYRKFKENIKIDPIEIGCEVMEWIWLLSFNIVFHVHKTLL